jgi:predicted kinase
MVTGGCQTTYRSTQMFPQHRSDVMHLCVQLAYTIRAIFLWDAKSMLEARSKREYQHE